MREPIEVDMSKPVFNAVGAAINRISIREPTASDIAESGWPFRRTRSPISGEISYEVKAGVMVPLVARCADLPIGAVRSMSALDFGQCIEAIEIFCLYRPVQADDGKAPEEAPGQQDNEAA